MINAAGHFKETQWRAILEAVINITVSLLLIKPLGMYGLLIGTICSFAYRTTDIIYYSHKHILNISCKKSVLRVLRVALVIAINVILYKLLVGKYIMNGWGEWIMYAVIASIIVLVTTGLIYFITEKKQFLPHLRVDFYCANGRLYVGELTFYHCSGFAPIQPEEWAIKMGDWSRFDDIDFDKLPTQFVLKCTHDSGGLVVCKGYTKETSHKSSLKTE